MTKLFRVWAIAGLATTCSWQSAGANPAPAQAPTPDTRILLNRSGLFFGARGGLNALRTGAQTVGVMFSNGTSAWSVSSDTTWLDVSPASGSGSGTFSVSVRNGTYTAGTKLTATLTVTAPSVPNAPLTLPVTLTILDAVGNPTGLVDTPLNFTTGVAGSIAVTGWAIDEIGIKDVTVWRDPVADETVSSPNGQIYVGRAIQVDGARPDVEARYSRPFNYRAGWGYMLLTNMLPNQGNGTFALHVYAEDMEGHVVLLGSRTMTCDNAHALAPFGAIDTPEQGGEVSGTAYTTFGWALTPQPNRIPADASTILVFIDGVPVGRPVYGQNRSDIALLFPGRANSDGAVGFFQFDTTQLASGMHTIAWAVSDNANNAEGIGSRFFSVLNGGTSSTLTLETSSSTQTLAGNGPDVRQSANPGADNGRQAQAIAAVPASEVPVYVREGFGSSASLDLVLADGRGVARVTTRESGRLALTLGSPVSGDADGYVGYLVANGRLAPLPTGAFLDRRSGDFFWHPGVGFVGTYALLFVRTEDGRRERIRVDVGIADF